MPIKFCRTKGLRLDRVIECEVLPEKLLCSGNQTMIFGYQYKVYGDPKIYRAEYKIDIVKNGKSRLSWLHQDKINRETYT
jgi:hypothetical protein